MKRNNYYTLFGLNNTISVLKADNCLEINVNIVEGSSFVKNAKLIKLLKQRQISSKLLEKKVFNKKSEEATQIMLHVHKKGIGVCGIFTYEVAESKCKHVLDLAKKNEHPLQCTMEKS